MRYTERVGHVDIVVLEGVGGAVLVAAVDDDVASVIRPVVRSNRPTISSLTR
ncbi:hypothetical protein [Streptomyces sp. 142MFCol3.1]|uniref:hypothetical protein n=1 Tax=Streptomyces sp. 142MFCol3.1 TaxID=1172179 RepID=UPI00040EC509|nr:hypothetical protein [Streptomyces sp. 142MFCol3.1]